MTLNEIVAKVAEKTGSRPAEVNKIIKETFETINLTVQEGKKVTVPGLGVFVLKSRAAGEAVDKKTGEARATEAASFAVLKPAKTLAAIKGAKKQGKAAAAAK